LKTDAWIHESFNAARTEVYRAPIGADESPATIVPLSRYEAEANRVARARIALAGARLAAVLNEELK
jgi:hypothetical protein